MWQGLCNAVVPVHLSVCPIGRPLQQRAADLLLGALRAVQSFGRCTLLWRVCCSGPAGQQISINNGGRQAPSSK